MKDRRKSFQVMAAVCTLSDASPVGNLISESSLPVSTCEVSSNLQVTTKGVSSRDGDN